MKTLALALSIAAASALASMPAQAVSKQKRHQHSARAYAAQPQIACSVLGCAPVPRGCHPEMGYTPDGTPTGFDVAVCGGYTLYGHRRGGY